MAVLGASTVYGLSWLTILIFPMLAVIQMISAHVGVAARHGLQSAVRHTYGRGWGFVLLVSVLAVNAITIGADLEAGAAALGLLFGIDFKWFVLPLAAVLLAILIWWSYDLIQRVLQYVLFVFAAYIVSAFLAHPDWGTVLHDTVFPPLSLGHTYVQGALALLGTTLTSYAYVWETIEESEAKKPFRELGLAKADAGLGMLFAVSIFWFILISTGATLGAHHQQVQTAQQAAQALVPVAGPIAGYIFAIGLLASAVLAVPVLAASSAYILSSEFARRSGLSQKTRTAPFFYLAVTASMAVAVAVCFIGISPMRLLFVAGIAGGLGTPISLVFLLLIARNRRVMRGRPIGNILMPAGWLITGLITAVSVYFLWQLV